MPGDAQFEEIAVGICISKSFAKPSFLGSGAFKEAYSTVTPNGLPVALKIFDPNKCNLFRAEREIDAMRQCESPFIARLHDWGVFDNNGKGSFLYVIEEFMAGGTLTDRLAAVRLDVIRVCNYGLALISAVSHLREKQLVHRDIKPDNIMFRSANDDVPILVDFGLVRDLRRASLTLSYLQQGPCTPIYASPEQLNNDKHLIDWRSDQFSIGVVLNICLFGSHPYQQTGQTDAQTVEQVITRAACGPEFNEKTGRLGCGFLTKMVSPWPIDRFPHPDLITRELEKLKEEQLK